MPKKLKIKFSFDDGAKDDLRLVRILADYDFANDVTFYIAPLKCGLSEREILNIGQFKYPQWRIGGHTMTHCRLTEVRQKVAWQEIAECRKHLTRLLCYPINYFCYPRGWYNDAIKEMVRDAGFAEARTTKVLQLKSEDPFETHTTIHCYQRKEYEGIPWLEVAKQWFLKAKVVKGTYHAWGHSYELERDKSWDKFVKLLDFIEENK